MGQLHPLLLFFFLAGSGGKTGNVVKSLLSFAPLPHFDFTPGILSATFMPCSLKLSHLLHVSFIIHLPLPPLLLDCLIHSLCSWVLFSSDVCAYIHTLTPKLYIHKPYDWCNGLLR